MYPSQLNPRDHYYSHHHHPAPPHIQGVRGQSGTLYPHMASSASYRVPPGNFAPQNTMNSGPSGSEMGSSHVGPVQPTGFRIYQHHQRDDSVPVATLRQHRGGVPRLRVMPDDVTFWPHFSLPFSSFLSLLKISVSFLVLSMRVGSCAFGVWRLPWWFWK